MSRRKLLRRFDSQYGVSEIVIAEEAKRLAREIDHREAVAPSRVEEWLKKSHASCRSCNPWTAIADLSIREKWGLPMVRPSHLHRPSARWR
jgi:hypothetical protein